MGPTKSCLTGGYYERARYYSKSFSWFPQRLF